MGGFAFLRHAAVLQKPPVTQKCGPNGWIWTRTLSTHLPAWLEARRKSAEHQDQSEDHRRERSALNAGSAIDRSSKPVKTTPLQPATAAQPRQGRPISNASQDIGSQLESLRSAGRPWRQIAVDMGRPEASIRKVYSRYRLIQKLSTEEWAAVRETAGRPYTPEEDAKLMELKLSGLDWAEIGIEMNRSPRACESRYYSKHVRGRDKSKGTGVSIAVPERPAPDVSVKRSPVDCSEASGSG